MLPRGVEKLSSCCKAKEAKKNQYWTMNTKIKLAIGMPTGGFIKTQTVFCLTALLKTLPFEYNLIFKEGSILHWNREFIVKTAFDLGCTHLLFVDSDMSFEKDAV